MGKNKSFFIFEFMIFFTMGIITLLEIFKFDFFEKVFQFSQVYISWFLGISFGFVFLGILQSVIKTEKISALEKRKSFFSLFLINLILSASLTAFIKTVALSFFNQFFIYFHVLFLQWIMLLYISFKLKNDYEISGKYFITNELIVLFYVSMVLIFVV